VATNARTGRNAVLGLCYLFLAALGAGLLAYAGDRDLGLMGGLLLLLLAASGFVLIGFDTWYVGHRPGVSLATAPSGVPATAFLRSRLPLVMSVAFCLLLVAWSVLGLAVAGGRIGFLVPAVVGLAPLAGLVLGRVSAGGLYLTPAGIEQRKEAVSWSLPWDHVAGVVPGEPLALTLSGPPPEPVYRTRWLWRREPTAPPGVLAVDSRYLAEDPVVVAELVARCIVDPGLRARMGSPEVVAELRRA